MPSVGQELLNVPFPQMVMSLAKAVADGQRALDKSSVETTRILAKEKVSLIEEIHEVVEARPFIAKDSDGNDIEDENGDPIRVTGATVTAESTEPKDYSLIQAGLFPTFYQFTESIIEVKMSISSKTASTAELDMGIEASGGWGPVHVSSHVNFKYSQTYSYSAEGSSLLRTTLKPVPPPARISPRIITVNTLVTPPTVTTG